MHHIISDGLSFDSHAAQDVNTLSCVLESSHATLTSDGILQRNPSKSMLFIVPQTNVSMVVGQCNVVT